MVTASQMGTLETYPKQECLRDRMSCTSSPPQLWDYVREEQGGARADFRAGLAMQKFLSSCRHP